MKGDFTRSTWDRRKRYAGVLMQQGRVQIDADWNEQWAIENHLRETALRDILGPGAVPASGGGFRIEVAPAGGSGAGDLLIGDGRLWIDGILCELGPGRDLAVEDAPAADELTLAAGEVEPEELAAGDWIEVRPAGMSDTDRGEMARIAAITGGGRTLELDRDVTDPGNGGSVRRWTSLDAQDDLPLPAGGEIFDPAAGTHLVYLDVWRRHVTALEDPAIRESALGGPDTATRVRTVCQVKLFSLGDGGGIDDDGNRFPDGFTCDDDLPEWDDLIAPPTGRLRARTRPDTDPENPCVVPSGGGYVGLEHQLYRVEVHDGGTLGDDGEAADGTEPTFKWSRDNGTVVTDWLGLDGDVLRVRSVGRDRTLSFHDARWVELTDDGRELRGEPGVLVRLLQVLDDEHLEIDPAGAALALADFPVNPKVRRWDLPDLPERADGALAIETPAADGGFLRLESGIEIRFEPGTYRSGDFWWVPARAFVGERRGDIEWPRDAGGAPLALSPEGIEHHYLRLALVEHDGEEWIDGSATDCRDPFCILPEACRSGDGGCCTVTVGPGGFPSVQAAIDALPDSGGEVCVRPGTYTGPVVIAGRENVHVHGCGGYPRLVGGGQGPAVRIEASRDVSLRHLEIDGGGEVSVELAGDPGASLNGVLLDDLLLPVAAESAVRGVGVRGVTLRNSRIALSTLLLGNAAPVTRPAVYLAGSDLLVEGNRIEGPPGSFPDTLGAGGVQIGGGSERVEIRENRLRGGHGNGITLGSVRLIEREDDDPIRIVTIFTEQPFAWAEPTVRLERVDTGAGFTPNQPFQPATNLVWRPNPPDDEQVWISEGDLEEVTITGNEIGGMGANGVAVAHFFEPVSRNLDGDGTVDETDGEMIVVRGLTLEGNHVHDCLRLGLGAFPEGLWPVAAYGGVTLGGAEDVTVRENRIEDNGATREEPVCGVYLLHAVGAHFEDNRITGNGRPADPPNSDAADEPPPGLRGGVVIGLAEAPTEAVAPLGGNALVGLRQDGTPALRFHGNVVVSPEGRALEVVAVGPVSILGNQLTAHGSHSLDRQPVPGAAGAFSRTTSAFDRIDLAAAVPFRDRGRAADPVRSFLDTLGGAVVAVVNLGVSNEVLLQLGGLSGSGLGGAARGLAGRQDGDRLYVGGNVMFHDNQVVLDAFRPAVTVAATAVSLFSWDDVSMVGNQCDCDLVLDAVWINSLVFSTSVRVTNNRFESGPLGILSAFTWGWFNSTCHNQGTHCFLTIGHPALSTTKPNASLSTVLGNDARGCGRWIEAGDTLSKQIADRLS